MANPLEPSLANPQEVRIDRDRIPEDLFLPERSTVIVGIGGHAAPPNSRLYSYLLPAVDLALKSQGDAPRLLLSSSVLEKRKRAPRDAAIEIQTFAKIYSLVKFLREFFPNAFTGTDVYLGESYLDVSDEQLCALWDHAAEIDPSLHSAYEQKRNQWHIADDSFIPYAALHPAWFRDITAKDDHELPADSNAVHVTIGGHQERFFNGVRNAVTRVDPQTLCDALGKEVSVHPERVQIVVENPTCTPYGETTTGANGSKKSVEQTLATSESPFSTHRKVAPDIDYTVRRLSCLSGASSANFEQFWSSQRREYERVVDELGVGLQWFSRTGHRKVLEEIGTFT